MWHVCHGSCDMSCDMSVMWRVCHVTWVYSGSWSGHHWSNTLRSSMLVYQVALHKTKVTPPPAGTHTHTHTHTNLILFFSNCRSRSRGDSRSGGSGDGSGHGGSRVGRSGCSGYCKWEQHNNYDLTGSIHSHVRKKEREKLQWLLEPMTWQMACYALTNWATKSFINSVAEFEYLGDIGRWGDERYYKVEEC